MGIFVFTILDLNLFIMRLRVSKLKLFLRLYSNFDFLSQKK